MTHTPRPWDADGIHIYGRTHSHTSVGTGKEVTWRSSFAIGNGWGSIEQRWIDARIMAASPDMLMALKCAESAISKTLDDRRAALDVQIRLGHRWDKLERIGRHLGRLGIALLEVRAAIAKAEAL